MVIITIRKSIISLISPYFKWKFGGMSSVDICRDPPKVLNFSPEVCFYKGLKFRTLGGFRAQYLGRLKNKWPGCKSNCLSMNRNYCSDQSVGSSIHRFIALLKTTTSLASKPADSVEWDIDLHKETQCCCRFTVCLHSTTYTIAYLKNPVQTSHMVSTYWAKMDLRRLDRCMPNLWSFVRV